MSEEYDLKKSTVKVGQLYPVILSKTGEVVDGFHRREADKKWKTVTNKTIDTKEKLLMARLIANKSRRSVPFDETKGWIDGLGEIALTQYKIEVGKIAFWIGEQTGYKEDTIRRYLDPKYKNMEQATRLPEGVTIEEVTEKGTIGTKTEGSNPAPSEKVKEHTIEGKDETTPYWIDQMRGELVNFNYSMKVATDLDIIRYNSKWWNEMYEFIDKTIIAFNEFKERVDKLQKEEKEYKVTKFTKSENGYSLQMTGKDKKKVRCAGFTEEDGKAMGEKVGMIVGRKVEYDPKNKTVIIGADQFHIKGI